MSFLLSSKTLIQPRWPAPRIAGLLACVLLFLGFVVIRGMPRWTSRPQVLKVQDSGLRRQAIMAPTPRYPSTSLAKNVSGVVVATVTLDVLGRQTRGVEILESPDAATGRAVRDAVRQWTFKPLGSPSRVTAITGNIIFYFHLMGGSGMVLSSDELQAIRGIRADAKKPQTLPVVRTIDEAEFRRTTAAVVLDTRSRAAHLHGHRDGTVNIPLSELATRANAELPRSGLVVIDCFAEQQFTGLCGMAARILTSHGFSELAVLNRSAE